MKKVWFTPAMANGQWALSKTVGVHATFKLTSGRGQDLFCRRQRLDPMQPSCI
jgi:hypothetical protein